MARERGLRVQREVLGFLRDGLTVREIAERRGTTVQAVYEVLRRLRSEGLVRKRRLPDFEVVEVGT